MQELNTENYRWVNGVWGMSIVGIMAFHLAQGLEASRMLVTLGLEGKHIGGLFFLIVGFGLSTHFLHKGVEKIKPKSFFETKLLRLYPVYFLTYIIFLAIFQFLHMEDAHLVSSGSTFIRLWGLGFTDETFSYLNNSWWFFWPIIQFYLIFPFFYWFFIKTSTPVFLAICLLITIFSRYLGQEGVMFTSSIFYWEQGLFIGTRLMEFALGMSLAKFLHANKEPIVRPVFLFIASAGLYGLGIVVLKIPILGMLAGLLKAVSSLGIFYSLYAFFEKNSFTRKTINPGFRWLGKYSFAIFLVHFIPFDDLREVYGAQITTIAMIGIGCLIFSIPIAYLVDKLAQKATEVLGNLRANPRVYLLLLGLSGGLLLAIFLLDMDAIPSIYQELIYFVILLWSLAILFVWYKSANRSLMVDFLCFSAIFSGFNFNYGVPPPKAVLVFIFGILFTVIGVYTYLFSPSLGRKDKV